MSRSGTPRLPLSHWSRHDIENLSNRTADHWTKMKVNSSSPTKVMEDKEKTADKKEKSSTNDRPTRTWSSPPNWYRRKHGNDLLRSCALFDQIVVGGMNGQVPGNLTRPTQSASQSLMRTSFNQRAREGFKYWPMERPRPTKFGRYGIGSYKTVLGLGNAPRT